MYAEFKSDFERIVCRNHSFNYKNEISKEISNNRFNEGSVIQFAYWMGIYEFCQIVKGSLDELCGIYHNRTLMRDRELISIRRDITNCSIDIALNKLLPASMKDKFELVDCVIDEDYQSMLKSIMDNLKK